MLFKLQILYYFLLFRLRKFRKREDVLRFQQKKWRCQRKFLLANSPFYKSFEPVPGLDVNTWPAMNKQEMMAHFDGLNTANLTKENVLAFALNAEENRRFAKALPGNLAVGLSSGTSGNRGLFVTNSRERAQWVAAVLSKVIGWSWHPRKVAFFLRADNKLYQSVTGRLLQFYFFDLLRPFADLESELDNCKPDILVGQPSVLLKLAIAQRQGFICINPQQIISVAEVLDEFTRAQIMEVFGLPVKEVYQCTEGFLAATCSAGRLHFNEDIVMINPHWLDEEKVRFFPVITDLNRQVQPVVNYVLNDIVHLRKRPCTCGSPFLCIEKIEGRADDMLLFETLNQRKVLVFPDIIRRLVLTQLPEVQHYSVLQDSMHTWSVCMECDDFSSTTEKWQTVFHEWCRSNQLITPEFLFSDQVKFDAMRKFRSVTRSKEISVEEAEFL